ncbi:MAG: hypothetical protein ACLR23_09515 [Clostridia bacterium]
MELEEIRMRNNLESVRDSIGQSGCEGWREIQRMRMLPGHKDIGADVVEQAATWHPQVGENKVQETPPKEVMGEKRMQFHMIGHLQRNKVHQVLDKVHLIHSVDSVRLAVRDQQRQCD